MRSCPDYVSTSGRDATELAALAGLHLDAWQQLVLDDMLGEKPDGSWVAPEVGLLVARQNGKNAVLEARELAGLFLFNEKLILHTAHEFKAAVEGFRRVRELIDNTDALRKRVKRMPQGHGDEAVELLSGQRLKFMARVRYQGRAFSPECMIFDEAQQLPQAPVDSMMYATSAQPNRQIIYTGTVPSVDNDAEHWTRVRDRGRAGGDPGLVWLEWSPGEDVADLDDRPAWRAANPAGRVTEQTIAMERAALSEDGFARERLSVWPTNTGGSVIAPNRWAALTDPISKPGDPVAFAVDVAPDRSCASIGVAGAAHAGTAHVEVVDARPGVGWVVPRLTELADRWSHCALVVDRAGPAGSLTVDMEAAGLGPHATSARELADACAGFYDAAVEGRLVHLAQPELDAALSGARTRPLGDAWAWSRRAGTDITPLVAVTLALHGLAKHRSKPSAAQPRIRMIGA